MTSTFDAQAIAHQLAAAWQGGPAVPAAQVPVADLAQAYAVQDATLAKLGAGYGWKAGATTDTAEPACAPLPVARRFDSGASVKLHPGVLRSVELEVAVLLGADLLPAGRLLSRGELLASVSALVPTIEVVDSRLAEARDAPYLVRLADLQSHGALVVGAESAMKPEALDLSTQHAQLWFDGERVADTTGGHKAPDIWRVLAWLAVQAEQRGKPLRAGQLVTTGSCTGLLVVPEGARVVGEVAGVGRVEIQL
jgi:2-keto-4-pentenoate hydratase